MPLGRSASVALDNQIRRQASRNVIGILPGRDPARRICALHRPLGPSRPLRRETGGDDICNGAIDNASGTAGLVALAEAHARAGAADRTIVFLAVTAEESGLLGSAYYADNPVYPLAQTAGGINMDCAQPGRRARATSSSIGAGKSELDAYLAPRRRARPASRLRPEPSPEAGYYYRSDHFSLAKQGVPMLYGQAAARIWSTAARPPGRAAAAGLSRQPLSPAAATNMIPPGTGPARCSDLRIFYAIGRELAESDALAELASEATNSAPSATARAPGSRRAMTARQPPEWAPHDCVWIGFPSHAELWEEDLEPARAEVAAFAARGPCRRQGRGGAAGRRRRRRRPRRRARLAPFATVVERAVRRHLAARHRADHRQGRRPALGARSFRFNGWGGKYELRGRRHDRAAARRERRPRRRAAHDWILEGGAIDVDGTGLAVTTEQCLLNPNRNPGLGRERGRGAAARAISASTACSGSASGLLNDHTDGHVDNLARFVGEGRLAIPEPAADDDPNAAVYRDARAPRRGASGSRSRPLPSPGRVERDGEIIPASYMNFYIGNAAVVVPLYGAANDEAAVAAIGALFPGREAVGLRADHILTGGGSFHCISQQVPRMTDQLTVAALQLAFTDDIDENIATVSELVREAAGKGAKVVLPPELFEGPYFCRTAGRGPCSPAPGRSTQHPAVLAMQQARRRARDLHPDQLLRGGRAASL